MDVSTYRAGFDAFWELDLFGRVRSAVRAAAANAESYELSLDDVRVIVAAEVARNYFELRAPQQQLAVAERTLANQRETLRLTQTYGYHATWTSSRDASKLKQQLSGIESAHTSGTGHWHDSAMSGKRWSELTAGSLTAMHGLMPR